MSFVLPNLFAGIEVDCLHRSPVIVSRIVLDLEGFLEERESRLVRHWRRTLDIHAGVLRRDVGHPRLRIDGDWPPVLATQEARACEDLLVDGRPHLRVGWGYPILHADDGGSMYERFCVDQFAVGPVK